MDTGYFYNITPDQQNWDIFLRIISPVVTLLLGAMMAFGFQRLAEFLRIIEVKKYLIHAVEDLKIAIDEQIIHLFLQLNQVFTFGFLNQCLNTMYSK